jgi:hypothetical protein
LTFKIGKRCIGHRPMMTIQMIVVIFSGKGERLVSI